MEPSREVPFEVLIRSTQVRSTPVHRDLLDRVGFKLKQKKSVYYEFFVLSGLTGLEANLGSKPTH